MQLPSLVRSAIAAVRERLDTAALDRALKQALPAVVEAKKAVARSTADLYALERRAASEPESVAASELEALRQRVVADENELAAAEERHRHLLRDTASRGASKALDAADLVAAKAEVSFLFALKNRLKKSMGQEVADSQACRDVATRLTEHEDAGERAVQLAMADGHARQAERLRALHAGDEQALERLLVRLRRLANP